MRIIAAGLLLACVVLALVLSGRDADAPQFSLPPAETGGQSQTPALSQIEREAPRIAAMRAEYARLEESREALRLQLGRLQARLWKLELPPGQAETVAARMQRGYDILRNPPLLGAFADRAEISAEAARVDNLYRRLLQLEADLFAEPGKQPAPVEATQPVRSSSAGERESG